METLNKIGDEITITKVTTIPVTDFLQNMQRDLKNLDKVIAERQADLDRLIARRTVIQGRITTYK